MTMRTANDRRAVVFVQETQIDPEEVASAVCDEVEAAAPRAALDYRVVRRLARVVLDAYGRYHDGPFGRRLRLRGGREYLVAFVRRELAGYLMRTSPAILVELGNPGEFARGGAPRGRGVDGYMVGRV